jgi:hypothetical protein
MMNRKSIIGAVVGLLLLSGMIGANLVLAQSPNDTKSPGASQEATDTDTDNLECPQQGLPACQGQMNDDKGEGPDDANDANDGDEGPESPTG